jgi:hypothetical protein
MDYFYSEDPNILILHQLYLIALSLSYDDEIGNSEMTNFLRRFISDTNLENYTMNEHIFRKINLNQSMIVQEEEKFSEAKVLEIGVENSLLPKNRKIILSMEDLTEQALTILLKINYNVPNSFFLLIMEMINDLDDSEEANKNKELQKEKIDKIKDVVAEINLLEEKKKTNRIEIEKQIKAKQRYLDELDSELHSLYLQERNIAMKILKLCEFVIKYSKLPPTMFNEMIHKFIIPYIKKKEFPEVIKTSYSSMGVLSINYFNNFKKFLKLFFDYVDKEENDFFYEFDKIALHIIFDSILHNNISTENMPQEIM